MDIVLSSRSRLVNFEKHELCCLLYRKVFMLRPSIEISSFKGEHCLEDFVVFVYSKWVIW